MHGTHGRPFLYGHATKALKPRHGLTTLQAANQHVIGISHNDSALQWQWPRHFKRFHLDNPAIISGITTPAICRRW